jgi:hypothetical protein
MLHTETAHVASGVFQAVVPAAFDGGERAAAQHADGFHHLVCDATPLHIQPIFGLDAQQAVHKGNYTLFRVQLRGAGYNFPKWSFSKVGCLRTLWRRGWSRACLLWR